MIILIILITLLIILIKKSSFTYDKSSFTYDKLSLHDITNKLYNGDKLNGYRLADIIFYPDYLTRKHKYSTRDHLYTYPNTIGVQYIQRKYPFLKKIKSETDFFKFNDEYLNFENEILSNLKSIKIDIDLLNEIIEEQNDEPIKINENILFLHIRVGDVLCKYPNSNHAILYSKKGNVKWWNSVINYIIQNNIQEVIIIAGTHFKECLYDSAVYLNEIHNYLESYNLKVGYRVGNSPDQDLIFCKNAKHFITTGGGYGYFLGKIVELNGGNFVLNKKDTIRVDRKLF